MKRLWLVDIMWVMDRIYEVGIRGYSRDIWSDSDLKKGGSVIYGSLFLVSLFKVNEDFNHLVGSGFLYSYKVEEDSNYLVGRGFLYSYNVKEDSVIL